MPTPTIRFPEGVYSDVRLEEETNTEIRVRDGTTEAVSSCTVTGAFARVYKNGGWYHAATTDVDHLSELLHELARADSLPARSDAVDVASRLTAHRVDARRFREARASTVSPTTKLASLQALLPVLDRPMISSHDLFFRDVYSQRRFRSSNGADVLRDHQLVGIAAGFSVKHEDETFREHYITGACTLDAMQVSQEQLLQRIEKAERFVSEAEPVEPGDYPVILSPLVAGGFAHESFGHKSEADFMTDDPSMLEAWKLGMQVGSDILSIVDDGGIEGAGFTAYDDEGQPAHKTWLVREGKLAGRLHSTQTAAILQEQTTGNARATTFEFPPIVRMTNTYIDAGTTKLGALFGSVKRGLFVETFKHGSGMSTFTIAPSMAWWVEDGEITKPARFSVLTGSVFETLGHIRAVSDEVELMHTPFGGCGKFNQFPLPVSFGGPHVLIDPMHVA